MRKIRLAAAVIALVALLYPCWYIYISLQPEEPEKLPDYVTYMDALEKIGDSLSRRVEAAGLKGYVDSVDEKAIQCPDKSIPTFVKDCNIVLSKPAGLLLIASDADKEKMVGRINELLRKGADIGKLTKKIRQATGIIPEFTAGCRWERLREPGECRWTIDLYRIAGGVKELSISQNFMHPYFIEKRRNEVEEYNRTLFLRSRNRERMAVISFSIFLVSFLLFAGLSVVIRARFWRLPKVMEKLEELATSGHFTAAYKLVENQLRLFPEYSDLVAFRERLLTFVKAPDMEPIPALKKAEEAYVEALKLKKMIGEAGEKGTDALNLLPSPEKEKIRGLIPYHPDLASNLAEYEMLEEERKKGLELLPAITTCKEEVGEGRLLSALEKAKKLVHDAPGNDECNRLLEEIKSLLEKEREDMERARESLESGDPQRAAGILNMMLQRNSECSEAEALLGRIERASANRDIVIKPHGNGMGSGILVFPRNSILLGRSSLEGMPDMEFDDRRVSRKHLRVNIADEKVLVEDLGSSGGSSVGGKSFDVTAVEGGEVISLAESVRLRVLVEKEEGTAGFGPVTGTALVDERGRAAVILVSRFDLSRICSPCGGDLHGSSSKRIRTNGCIDAVLEVVDGVLMIQRENSYRLLVPGERFEIDRSVFMVEKKGGHGEL